MKRKFYLLLSLTGLFLIGITACNKEEDLPESKSESSNSLVYEDKSIEEEISPYFYDNHIYRIELLGVNRERDQIVDAALEEGLEMEFLLIDEAQKFFFNHTGVIMYSIPTLDPEQKLIIYASKGLHLVSMAQLRPAEQGRMAFTLKTMDDREYFSLKLDDQMRMGALSVHENEEVKSFSQRIYSLTYREESQDESLKDVHAECCRKESGWKSCMNCTTSDCADSWLCKAAGIVAPFELVAAMAASCIGSGPDARC